MSKEQWLFKSFRSFVICLSVLVIMLTFPVIANSQEKATEGRKVYEKYCIGCHGDKGDGNGVAAEDLIIKPRNFTLGVFKFKSTPRASLPTDEDLKQVITNGLPTSSMPNFKLVPDTEKEAVVAYIKSLSERWKKERPRKKFPEVSIPGFVGTPRSIQKGEKLYSKRCEMCHGTKKGAPDVAFFLNWKGEGECKDSTRPANFNHGVIKRGKKVEDIYSSITAGVEGTPMLSFANLLSENDRWHLTSYILEIMGKARR